MSKDENIKHDASKQTSEWTYYGGYREYPLWRVVAAGFAAGVLVVVPVVLVAKLIAWIVK